ncbi:hypothetical protein DSM104329_02118 [Capillimicrobium parvum]|uniref:Glycosyltransferase family 1 protein n=2 Tax=Capillimicrobium parvum TaxID=2884022 RepID=A0A9E6XX63_9ACTN|nr:hypothetical protein DSM104329_02118 [Capillimicrobium parvum]
MLAGVPRQGGATWAVLQYVLGLRRLGHDVLFVEPVDHDGAALERTPAAAYFRDVVARFGLAGRAALLDASGGATLGLRRGELDRLIGGADVLLNLSGMLDAPIMDRVPVRAFVDLDPGFTQLWHEAQGIDLGFDRHNRFVTVGQSVGAAGGRVPSAGRPWISTLPPVVLEHWPVADRPASPRLTTIGHWRAYGSIEHQGVHYGQKAHSLRRLIDLPRRLGVRVMLALGIHPDETEDIAALHRHGWQLSDPDVAAGTPRRYEDFVRCSWAELGIAKSGYVAADCGWFSDRSVCYLATGRPVIAQETGFSEHLPTGDGLLAFRTGDEAVAAVEALRRDYPRHRRAARAIAEEVFESDRVLSRLLACL